MAKRVIIRARKLYGVEYMIDALFGSKTRVKLLHLFLNNPGQSFFVREITRKIDEQINSVRRELANMLEVGIIVSDSSNNKLYYQVNQRYDYYVPFRTIFSDTKVKSATASTSINDQAEDYSSLLGRLHGARLVITAGILVDGSNSPVDILIVGDVSSVKVKLAVKEIESTEGRDINYSVLLYDEFYYRLSVKDRFITEILNSQHKIILDKDKVLIKE
ncbi:MAG: transcriptional regulator [Candidatus Saccharibacteria bacterium]